MITVCAKNTSAAYLKNNQRAWIEYVECEKTDECPLYKTGKCACYRYLIGSNMCCPNGTWKYIEGPTKRSKSFQIFVENAREYVETAKEHKDKLCIVAGYVYIPLPNLTEIEEIVNGFFVETEKFTEDIVEKIVTFNFSPWIPEQYRKKYRNEKVPKFLQQLKEIMPDIFESWQSKYTESAEKYKELSPVGRTAYISTLPDGCILSNGSGNFTKRGEYIVSDNYRGFLRSLVFGARNGVSVSIRIEPDMTVKVTEKMIVDENTKYGD